MFFLVSGLDFKICQWYFWFHLFYSSNRSSMYKTGIIQDRPAICSFTTLCNSGTKVPRPPYFINNSVRRDYLHGTAACDVTSAPPGRYMVVYVHRYLFIYSRLTEVLKHYFHRQASATMMVRFPARGDSRARPLSL